MEKQYVPNQLCPKCNGQGVVSKPPYIAGDVDSWICDQTTFTCNVCNGAKVIPLAEIEMPICQGEIKPHSMSNFGIADHNMQVNYIQTLTDQFINYDTKTTAI